MLSHKKLIIEKYFEPLLGYFSKANPNALTILGSIPSILFFVFVVNGMYAWAMFAFIGMAFDIIDGMVARKYNKVTKFGGFLDSTFDRISDFLIISAFAFGGIARWEIVTPLIFFSILISYTRSRGELANPNVSFAVGIIERTERLVLIIISLILYLIFPNVSIISFNLVELGFIILLILSLYTVIQRILFAYRKL